MVSCLFCRRSIDSSNIFEHYKTHRDFFSSKESVFVLTSLSDKQSVQKILDEFEQKFGRKKDDESVVVFVETLNKAYRQRPRDFDRALQDLEMRFKSCKKTGPPANRPRQEVKEQEIGEDLDDDELFELLMNQTAEAEMEELKVPAARPKKAAANSKSIIQQIKKEEAKKKEVMVRKSELEEKKMSTKYAPAPRQITKSKQVGTIAPDRNRTRLVFQEKEDIEEKIEEIRDILKENDDEDLKDTLRQYLLKLRELTGDEKFQELPAPRSRTSPIQKSRGIKVIEPKPKPPTISKPVLSKSLQEKLNKRKAQAGAPAPPVFSLEEKSPEIRKASEYKRKGKSISSVPDSAIKSTIVDTFKFNVVLSEDVKKGIKITVNNGIVTLSGNVESQFQKNTASSTIKYIQGVKSIINNIIVKESKRAPLPYFSLEEKSPEQRKVSIVAKRPPRLMMERKEAPAEFLTGRLLELNRNDLDDLAGPILEFAQKNRGKIPLKDLDLIGDERRFSKGRLQSELVPYFSLKAGNSIHEFFVRYFGESRGDKDFFFIQFARANEDLIKKLHENRGDGIIELWDFLKKEIKEFCVYVKMNEIIKIRLAQNGVNAESINQFVLRESSKIQQAAKEYVKIFSDDEIKDISNETAKAESIILRFIPNLFYFAEIKPLDKDPSNKELHKFFHQIADQYSKVDQLYRKVSPYDPAATTVDPRILRLARYGLPLEEIEFALHPLERKFIINQLNTISMIDYVKFNPNDARQYNVDALLQMFKIDQTTEQVVNIVRSYLV